jgi:hypothetical protein
MSRFLVVAPPLIGYLDPIAEVAKALRDRGHDVAWCGGGETLARTLSGSWLIRDCAVPTAVRDLRPDVVLVNHEALVGPQVAERAGIAWITAADALSEFAGRVSTSDLSG